MDEQFKNLKFDMDEEIEARNEREGRLVHTAYRAAPPMSVSHAIVLAAIIIVVGLWGGKLAYDYWQAKQMEAALIYAAQSFKAATQGSERQFQQQAREAQRQAEMRAAQLEQQRRDAERGRAMQAAQAQKEQRLQSPECRFWWDQQRNNPNAKNEAKRMQSCGG